MQVQRVPVAHTFKFDREGHVESGDPEFDKRMGTYVKDYFQSHPDTPGVAPKKPGDPAPKLPDLLIPHLGSTDLVPHPGDAVTFELTVLNGGLGDASPFHVSVHCGDQYQAEEPVPGGLKSYRGVTLCFPSDDPNDPNDPFQTAEVPADYWVNAKADSQNEVKETNKVNNEEHWLMTVM